MRPNFIKTIQILEAKRRILLARLKRSNQLNLNNLSLTTEDLKKLMPSIQKIPNLKELSLCKNKLTELPKEIGNLTKLEELNLGNNQLTELPKEIGKLTNLETLELQDNQLTILTKEIGNLTKLEALGLQENKLTTLPEEIGKLMKLKLLNLGDNQLTELPKEIGNLTELERIGVHGNRLEELPDQLTDLKNLTHLYAAHNLLRSLPKLKDAFPNLEMLDLRNHLLPEDKIEEAIEGVPDTVGIQTEFQPTTLLEKALRTLYNNEVHEVQDKIKELDLGTFVDNEGNELTAEKVLAEFLKNAPLAGSGADITEVYKPYAKYLVDQILEGDDEKKQECLSKMATSLGNCSTPVRSMLIQGALGKEREKEGEIPEIFRAIELREIIKYNAETKLKHLFKDEEKIEQVEALVNIVCLRPKHKDQKYNPIKIVGKRLYSRSGTRNIEYGFTIMKYDKFKKLRSEFAKMLCKTGDNGGLLVNKANKTGRRYFLDPEKLKACKENYYANCLGEYSEREKIIARYGEEMVASMSKYELGMHLDKEDVVAFFDPNKLKEELRGLLRETEDDQIENVYEKHLAMNQIKILQLSLKYDKKLLRKMISTPMVRRERSNTFDQTASRSQAPKKDQKHRRSKSGSSLHP